MFATLARSVELSLGEDNRAVTLEVRDDGKGFDVQTSTDGGLGLSGMRERANLLGAIFRCESGPGRGTLIIVEMTRSRPSTDS